MQKTDGGGDAVSALQPLIQQLMKGYENDKQVMKEMMEELVKKQRHSSVDEANKTAQQLKEGIGLPNSTELEALREMADMKRQMELEAKKMAHRERVDLFRFISDFNELTEQRTRNQRSRTASKAS